MSIHRYFPQLLSGLNCGRSGLCSGNNGDYNRHLIPMTSDMLMQHEHVKVDAIDQTCATNPST